VFYGDGSGLYNLPESAVDLSGYAKLAGGNTFTSGDQTITGSVYITNKLSNGENTTVTGDFSHAEGEGTIASGSYSHAEGIYTVASGNHSHAEGAQTLAIGDSSHAEGQYTTSSATHSHAEGYLSVAAGQWSHAEGFYSVASGAFSHAEGWESKAVGQASHAEGNNTKALFGGSHAEGDNTIASASYQHVQGRYNKTDSLALMLVGNGSHDLIRSNILEVYSGSVVVSGTLQNTGGIKVNISNQTSDYTIDSNSDYIITFSGTNLTGTLPDAALSVGSTFIIKNKDTSPLFITSSGGLIDGASDVTINTQYYSYTLVSDGTDWNVI